MKYSIGGEGEYVIKMKEETRDRWYIVLSVSLIAGILSIFTTLPWK